MNNNTLRMRISELSAVEVPERTATRYPTHEPARANSCHKDEGHTEAVTGINRTPLAMVWSGFQSRHLANRPNSTGQTE